jgi:glycosyltransferase involved in cell wall biosynthesis
VTTRPFAAPAARKPLERREAPSFSIAIAAYQAADTIGETLESALAQTVAPVDIAVCDDGSTDDLERALSPYLDRIVLVRQENQGEAAAKNAAARATSGEFVAFLDADDLYHPERLEALGELARARPDLDVLTTNADLEVDGRIVGRYYPDISTFPVDRQAEEVITHESAILGAAAVRRSTFDSAGGLRESLRSQDDWELWMRLVIGGSLIGLVDQPLYVYRVHGRGTSADQLRVYRNSVRALEYVLAESDPGPAELAALRRGLRHRRRLSALTEVEAALRTRAPEARARSRKVAADRDFPLPTRLKAALAAASPGVARYLLERRERATGQSRLRKQIPPG